MQIQKQTLTKLTIGLILLFCAYNIVTLSKEIISNQRARGRVPFVFYGEYFSTLQDLLKNESRIGYFSDRNLKESGPQERYLQIQYALAPIILDTKNILQQRYIMLNCSDHKNALAFIEKYKLKPLKQNSFGVIIAEKMTN